MQILSRLSLMLALLVSLPPAAARADDSSWLPAPGASGDSALVGFVDAPSSGATIASNATIEVRGWVVDPSASGSSGIDNVQVYLGSREPSGIFLAQASVAIPRPDVAAAFGNPAWLNSGFSVAFAPSGLRVGGNVLSVYAHSPSRGWWYRQLQLEMPAPPDRGFADDPLVVFERATAAVDALSHSTTSALTISGYAIDRNMPADQSVGVGGSGISQIQVYLDGPRNGGAGSGTFLGNATLGLKNRTATGFGQRFLNSGFVITVHPTDFTVDRHALFIYVDSAFWPSETLVIIPINVL